MAKVITDAQFVQKALGDVDHFGPLIERYEKRLLAYVMRISYFSKEKAEDVLQEVFLKVWQNLNSFDQKLKFSSWIYRITRNHVISQYRKTKNEESEAPLDESLYHLRSSELEIPAALDKKLHAAEIRALLDSLPEAYKDVLILRFLEDRTYEEISDILHKPGGTVATLLSRAKKLFKSKLT